jgi:hypothetical protein
VIAKSCGMLRRRDTAGIENPREAPGEGLLLGPLQNNHGLRVRALVGRSVPIVPPADEHVRFEPAVLL